MSDSSTVASIAVSSDSLTIKLPADTAATDLGIIPDLWLDLTSSGAKAEPDNNTLTVSPSPSSSLAQTTNRVIQRLSSNGISSVTTTN